jgi:hypothetical protein
VFDVRYDVRYSDHGVFFYVEESRPPLWSSGESSWLENGDVRFRFSALIDFLRSSGSGTGSVHSTS